MKNPRALILSIVMGLIALLMQFSCINKERAALLHDSELIPTVIATRNIPKNVKLDETMVKVELVPRKWQQPGALGKGEDVYQQISASPIQEGEQVLLTKLVSLEDAGLAFKVPKRKRGIAVAVYEVNAVGGHIKPGNYVDIMGSFDFGTGDKADLRTITLFQNVLVLAVGDDLGQSVPQSIDEAAAQDNYVRATTRNNGTIVVSLTPLECQKITLAQEMGSLSLTLRSLWEDQRFVDLEKTSIHTAIGIPKKVRYQRKASYRTIREGSF
ncbi:MAG: Flp pilus assembly protein CpaB [Myxococcota bacterium]